MNIKAIYVRRKYLLESISNQRSELNELSHALEPLAKAYDRAAIIASNIRKHPKLVLGTTLVVLFLLRKHLHIGQIGLATITAAKWWTSLKNR